VPTHRNDQLHVAIVLILLKESPLPRIVLVETFLLSLFLLFTLNSPLFPWLPTHLLHQYRSRGPRRVNKFSKTFRELGYSIIFSDILNMQAPSCFFFLGGGGLIHKSPSLSLSKAHYSIDLSPFYLICLDRCAFIFFRRKPLISFPLFLYPKHYFCASKVRSTTIFIFRSLKIEWVKIF